LSYSEKEFTFSSDIIFILTIANLMLHEDRSV